VDQPVGKKEEHPLEFARLSQYFEKLEKTSSRLALIKILAELFRLIERPDEIAQVCYLVQGRVAPIFEALEIGMAEKTVARSIAIAYHTTPEHVFKLYATLGDLGLVAEQRSREAGRVSNVLQVDDVFEGLKTIAQTAGKGMVEKRIALLADLLRQVDSVSAKYVVRIALGNLRLGIGDSTILDALATAKFHDTHKRKVLEGAYNKTSDLGLIARTLWQYPGQEDALRAVAQLDIQVGKPIRPQLAERLPDVETIIKKMGWWMCNINTMDCARRSIKMGSRCLSSRATWKTCHRCFRKYLKEPASKYKQTTSFWMQKPSPTIQHQKNSCHSRKQAEDGENIISKPWLNNCR